MSEEMPQTTTDLPPTDSGQRTDSILVGPGGAATAMPSPARHRPIMVTLLAIFTGFLAVLSALHLLQSLGIIPFVVGRFEIRAFSIFYAIMWGLLVWAWVWVTRMLWRVEPQAWIFLVAISMFNLMLDFVLLLGDSTWESVSLSFVVNALVLVYCMLPSTRRAFSME